VRALVLESPVASHSPYSDAKPREYTVVPDTGSTTSKK
jgi:hypothetical protein